MPLLFPASIEEYVRFGLAGIALSRFSGLWVGFKAVTEIIESAGSIPQPTLPRFQNPDFAKPVPICSGLPSVVNTSGGCWKSGFLQLKLFVMTISLM